MSRRISPGSNPDQQSNETNYRNCRRGELGTIIDGNPRAVRNPPTDGFIVDDTYDPSTISGPVWLMYDRTTDSGETEGDVYQLESQFKVIDAEGYDGEP